jgi:hypothetical protein
VPPTAVQGPLVVSTGRHPAPPFDVLPTPATRHPPLMMHRGKRAFAWILSSLAAVSPFFQISKILTINRHSGIAGLSAAYALAVSGHRVQVFEQAHGLKHEPGGTRLPPNATRILTHWGVEKELAQKGATTSSSSILDSECHRHQQALPVSVACTSRARQC